MVYFILLNTQSMRQPAKWWTNQMFIPFARKDPLFTVRGIKCSMQLGMMNTSQVGRDHWSSLWSKSSTCIRNTQLMYTLVILLTSIHSRFALAKSILLLSYQGFWKVHFRCDLILASISTFFTQKTTTQKSINNNIKSALHLPNSTVEPH